MSFIIRKFWYNDFCKRKLANDPRIGCKYPFSLVDFIKNDLKLEKKLEEFEGTFERDKVVEL